MPAPENAAPAPPAAEAPQPREGLEPAEPSLERSPGPGAGGETSNGAFERPAQQAPAEALSEAPRLEADPARPSAGEVRTSEAQASSSTEAASETRRPALSQAEAEAVMRQVRLRIRPDLREATIQLRPPRLGRIAIQVALVEDGVQATLRVERPEALGVLEAHAPELRAMFEQAGLQARELDLELGFQEQEAGASGRRDADTSGGAAGWEEEMDEAGSEAEQAVLGEILVGRGGIDTYA